MPQRTQDSLTPVNPPVVLTIVTPRKSCWARGSHSFIFDAGSIVGFKSVFLYFRHSLPSELANSKFLSFLGILCYSLDDYFTSGKNIPIASVIVIRFVSSYLGEKCIRNISGRRMKSSCFVSELTDQPYYLFSL